MSGRVTADMTASSLLANLQAVAQRLSETQTRLSSGKQLTRPSDDPFGAGRALQLRADVAANKQYQRNVDEASSWQNVTDTALSRVGDVAMRARELLVQAANGTLGQQGRDAIAAEISQLIDSAKTELNTQYAGRYVFSGTATTTAPYQLGDPTDTYGGNTDAIVREIGPGVQVQVNAIGSDVASGLLGALRSALTNLATGDQAALQADAQAVSDAHDAIVDHRAVVGARVSRLETAGSRLDDIEGVMSKLLSETEDADMAKTLIDYSMQQAVYQSALKAGAQLIQPSLIDFIR